MPNLPATTVNGQIENLRDAFELAMAAGNYSLARDKLITAMGIVAVVPNVRQDGAQIQWRIGNQSFTDLTTVLAELDSLAAVESAGADALTLQRTKIEFT